MSDEMNVKISDIKAKFIKNEAKMVDKYFGNGDGSINKEEGAKLAQVLNGELGKSSNLKKLGKESDEVKAIFGLTTTTTPIERTEIAPVAAKTAKTYKTPFQEVKARFLEVMEYDEESNTSNGTTAKEAYKKVKKEFKGKGKEYKEAISELKDYAKHGFVNMRAQKTRASVQAYDAEGRLVNAENLKYDTSRKVYKREKELTKENNNGVKDKWAKKALRNRNTSSIKKFVRYIGGNDSAGKTDDKAVAAGNRAVNIRENKTFSKEAIKEALGKNNPLVKPYTDKQGRTYENVLVATGLITLAPNGEYIVKNLSKTVGDAIGADNTINDHDNHNESEIQSVLTNLYQKMRANGSGEFKTSELSDKDVRRLVEFLGYRDDRQQLMAVRLWQNIWKGAAAGALAGGAAGAANGSYNVHIKEHEELNIDFENYSQNQVENLINGLKSEDALKSLPVTTDMGAGTVNTTLGNVTATSTGIHIAKDVLVNRTLVSTIKAITVGALTGGGVGAALGALDTLGSHAREREVLGMVFDCDTTFEEILDTIDNAYSDKYLSPEMKEALKKVAELGIVTTIDPKTGVRKAVLDENCNVQWDYCQFMEEYNKARGNQIFNAAEVRAAARTEEKYSFEIPECDPVVEIVQDNEEECTDCTPKKGDKPVKIPPHAWNREGGESWIEIVKAKYPCLYEELKKAGIDEYSKNGAIKVMQRELATDEDGNFHADKYKGITGGDIPKHLDFPDEITVTVNGKEITCKYEDNPVKKKSQKELGTGSKNNNGRYGYGRKGNIKTYTDDCHTGIVGEGKTDAEAKANFDKKVKEAQK